MGHSNNLPYPAIKQWEDFSASLVASTKDYLDHCCNLGTEALCQGAKPKDLAAQIDANMEATHATISHQLAESCAVLSWTQNKLVSPFYCFPKEVTSEIFLNVVYDYTNYTNKQQPKSLPADEEVKLIYHRLCKLLKVCLTWREIVVSTRLLWLVIPLVETHSGKQLPFELALERSSRTKQHLAYINNMQSPALQDALMEVLQKYGDRFHNISLSTISLDATAQAIQILLQHGTSLSLSKLSIKTNDYANHRVATSHHPFYLFDPDSPDVTSFAKLVGALSTFYISDTYIYWNTITFSSQLVELCISHIALSEGEPIFQLLYALNSASELRDLKIISLSTRRDSEVTFDPKIYPMVVLLNLQSLHLQSLYSNTLEVLLSKIAPGTHRLTLYFGYQILQANLSGMPHQNNPNPVDISHLCAILKAVQVDTLLLSVDWSSPWLPGGVFRRLLKAMPTLKTLKMGGWVFDSDDSWSLKHLTRSINGPEDSQDSLPPALENIYLNDVAICDQANFWEMVLSHSPQQVILGGREAFAFSLEGAQFKPLQESSELVQWLRSKVPNTRLVDSEYRLPEFYEGEWRLW